MTIGDRILKMRKACGYSQGDVAKLLGVSNQAIGKYEHGVVSNLPMNRLKQLASILNCDPDYLLGIQDEPRVERQQEKAPPSEKEMLIAEIVKHLEKLSPAQMKQVVQYAQFLRQSSEDF